MAERPDGLASMNQARERRARRAMPPPRHPLPAKDSETTTHQDQQTATPVVTSLHQGHTAAAVETETAYAESDAAPNQEAPSTEPAAQANEPAVEVGDKRPPRPATVYLEDDLIEFLDEARIAGLTSRPRVDISMSAVVRLALRRLQQQMTSAQIRDHLAAQPTDPHKTGRKRR